MILLPEFQVTATSNMKASYCKTIQISRTDNTFTSTSSGVNLVKAIIPADATLQDFQIWTANGSNAGTSATLYLGVKLPFTSIVAAGTTATVTTPVFHNLVTGDTIVVNGTGQANFDQATPVAITVTSTTTFTYTISSTTATATVGDIGVASYFINPTSALNSTQVTVALGASPASYTVSTYGNLVVNGGTVSAITITRPGGSAVTLGVTAGMFAVQAGDVITITYTVAPTVTFIPNDRSANGYLNTVTKRVGPPSAGWVNAATGTQGVPIGSDLQVFGMYKETGTASTQGGPWYVTVWYVR
jgi:hypothetical protein